MEQEQELEQGAGQFEIEAKAQEEAAQMETAPCAATGAQLGAAPSDSLDEHIRIARFAQLLCEHSAAPHVHHSPHRVPFFIPLPNIAYSPVKSKLP